MEYEYVYTCPVCDCHMGVVTTVRINGLMHYREVCFGCGWFDDQEEPDGWVCDSGTRRPSIVNLSPVPGSAYGPKGLSEGLLGVPSLRSIGRLSGQREVRLGLEVNENGVRIYVSQVSVSRMAQQGPGTERSISLAAGSTPGRRETLLRCSGWASQRSGVDRGDRGVRGTRRSAGAH